MNKSIFIIPCFLLFILQTGYTATKDVAALKFNDAESIKKSLETRSELSAFIPYDTFNMGDVSLQRARVFLQDGKYADAAYYATDASIRFEIASIVAQTRSARHERIKLLSDWRTTGIMTNPVMDAHFLKKGDVFRSNIYDRQVFVIKNNHIYYKISSEGKERLDKIIKVLTIYSNFKMRIVGHTAEPDYNDYSKQKADIIAKYFYEKNIPADRIEIIGIGNKEVLDTHLGYRRVDRVEFIISATK